MRTHDLRGALRRAPGFQLIELSVILGLVSLLVTVAVPNLLAFTARHRVTSAAAELAGTLQLTRATASRLSCNVGVKFRTAPDGTVTFTLYQDGDGDGVLTADIDSGVDRAVGPERRLGNLGPRVGFGFPPPPAPRDPADPGQRLEGLDDPIRFNRSDIASFTSLGASTPGSLYVSDHQRHLAVVRVLGHTGRIRILLYDVERQVWEGR
jgi:hypothetical protein